MTVNFSYLCLPDKDVSFVYYGVAYLYQNPHLRSPDPVAAKCLCIGQFYNSTVNNLN